MIVPAHCKRAKFKWNYQHTEIPVEEQTKNWYNKDRKVLPKESTNQEGQNDQTTEERGDTLGGASSSKAKKPRTDTGSRLSKQQQEKKYIEAKAQREAEKKVKEEELKITQDALARQQDEDKQKKQVEEQQKKTTKRGMEEKIGRRSLQEGRGRGT